MVWGFSNADLKIRQNPLFKRSAKVEVVSANGDATLSRNPDQDSTMPTWIQFVFYLFMITIPATIVYLTAREMIRQHLASLERLQAAHNRSAKSAEILPLRLQAYERLSLFCERIALPNLLLRLQQSDQSAAELKLTLYLAIQAEYEHNISQQVYMSQQLWDIIRQARDNTLQSIEAVSDIIEPDQPARQLARALLDQASPSSNAGLAMALAAIKKEASLLFD